MVQEAWLHLSREDGLMAEAVRQEYQVMGLQADKAKAMGFGRGRFRELLAEGRGWMFAKLCQRAAA
jgi:hypothetical protein